MEPVIRIAVSALQAHAVEMRMSARFWMIAAGFTVSGMLAGASLGGFAAGRAQGGLMSAQWASDNDAEPAFGTVPFINPMAQAQQVAEKIVPVECKGCGPTLAERQMADGWGGDAVDPYLRDYGRSEPDEPVPSPDDERTKAMMARLPTPLLPVVDKPVATTVETAVATAQ